MKSTDYLTMSMALQSFVNRIRDFFPVIVVGIVRNTVKCVHVPSFLSLLVVSCFSMHANVCVCGAVASFEYDNHNNNEECCWRLKKNRPVTFATAREKERREEDVLCKVFYSSFVLLVAFFSCCFTRSPFPTHMHI